MEIDQELGKLFKHWWDVILAPASSQQPGSSNPNWLKFLDNLQKYNAMNKTFVVI